MNESPLLDEDMARVVKPQMDRLIQSLAGLGAKSAAPGPQVKVFDGRTLAVLSSYSPFDPAFLGGVYVG